MAKTYGYKIWTGTPTEYKSLHARISKMLGRPKLCELCGTTEAKLYDWANISGKYIEEAYDWERLCRKCHMRKDGRAFSKPATGMKHTDEAKQKIAEASRRLWRTGRMKPPAIMLGKDHPNYKHGKYAKKLG